MCGGVLSNPDVMDNLQYSLLKAQRYPVLGPLFVSTSKALISLVELIVGLVGTIFLGLLALFISECFKEKAFASLYHFRIGLEGLGYSLANIFTLGLAGEHLLHHFREMHRDGTKQYN